MKKPKVPWHYYSARVGLGIWVTYLVGTMITIVGTASTMAPGELFTWWDIGSATIVFGCTIALAYAAGWEHYQTRQLKLALAEIQAREEAQQ